MSQRNTPETDAIHELAKTTYSENDIKILAEFINAAGRIISLQSTANQEQSIIGTIKHGYPKGNTANELAKIARSGGAEIVVSGGKKLHFGFSRKNETMPWYMASFSPYHSPSSNMKFNVTKDFFTRDLGLVLEKTTLEQIPFDSIEFQNVFYFRSKTGNKNVLYTFRADPKISKLEDGYPPNFYDLEIERLDAGTK